MPNSYGITFETRFLLLDVGESLIVGSLLLFGVSHDGETQLFGCGVAAQSAVKADEDVLVDAASFGAYLGGEGVEVDELGRRRAGPVGIGVADLFGVVGEAPSARRSSRHENFLEVPRHFPPKLFDGQLWLITRHFSDVGAF